MEKLSGVVEKRVPGKPPAQIPVTYRVVVPQEADELMVSQGYKDLTKPEFGGPKTVKDVLTLVTEHITLGDVKIVSAKTFTAGETLAVELNLQGAPIPIRTMAVVKQTLFTKNAHGKFEATPRFFAINREDVARVERHLAKVRAAQASQPKKT